MLETHIRSLQNALCFNVDRIYRLFFQGFGELFSSIVNLWRSSWQKKRCARPTAQLTKALRSLGCFFRTSSVLEIAFSESVWSCNCKWGSCLAYVSFQSRNLNCFKSLKDCNRSWKKQEGCKAKGGLIAAWKQLQQLQTFWTNYFRHTTEDVGEFCQQKSWIRLKRCVFWARKVCHE